MILQKHIYNTLVEVDWQLTWELCSTLMLKMAKERHVYPREPSVLCVICRFSTLRGQKTLVIFSILLHIEER